MTGATHGTPAVAEHVGTLDAPRSPYVRKKTTRGNYELYSWVFMRASGVVLVVLVFGHLFVNLMVGEGVKAIDFAFVGGKWSSPFWQIWDLLMLWLAMIHGTNGLRTIINDYAERDVTRGVLKGLLYLAFTIVVVLGTLVIFTFEPCPVGADPELLASFCTA
ncbi:succinate dehydrogenase hydrophobic membrane anchor subunit [Myceligenerans xiligouense]|uniref:Succinate dehydrogenase subunit D n=1 Tax=Myceligenerans xiligouense TaxID=253184 RepID=A0A3N4YSK5_9MICO|nr:succinate dehydrogenase hydrophobic membrane anchor subunit [Myceligenerans xiligouense]RPF22486.1 succinate dehydrogenase subunit D [Myceligenerans xiligouense]